MFVIFWLKHHEAILCKILRNRATNKPGSFFLEMSFRYRLKHVKPRCCEQSPTQSENVHWPSGRSGSHGPSQWPTGTKMPTSIYKWRKAKKNTKIKHNIFITTQKNSQIPDVGIVSKGQRQWTVPPSQVAQAWGIRAACHRNLPSRMSKSYHLEMDPKWPGNVTTRFCPT